MAFSIIVIIILVGILLIFLEMFVIAGTALLGILGGVAIVAGVALMYNGYGNKWGNISAALAGASVFIAVAAGFKVIQSNKLAMKAEIKSKVNTFNHHPYQPGQKGRAVSELRPNGKAIFADSNKIDVYSEGEYIERGSEIEIVKITHNKIFVKQFKT